MSNHTSVVVRNAREQDLPAVAEIAAEVFSARGAAEKLETFRHRLAAFPNGFFIIVAENEIAGYACSEKWLAERRPGLNEDALTTHQPDGRLFYITGMAVREKFRGRGYRLLLLDKLIEIAHLEGCKRLLVETAHSRELYLQRGFTVEHSHTDGGVSTDVLSLDLKPIRMIE